MHPGEESYTKVYESPCSPRRIVLKPALHDGRQDTTSIEETASNAHSSKCRETWDGHGILLQPHPARLRRGGNHQTNGGRQ